MNNTFIPEQLNTEEINNYVAQHGNRAERRRWAKLKKRRETEDRIKKAPHRH